MINKIQNKFGFALRISEIDWETYTPNGNKVGVWQFHGNCVLVDLNRLINTSIEYMFRDDGQEVDYIAHGIMVGVLDMYFNVTMEYRFWHTPAQHARLLEYLEGV